MTPWDYVGIGSAVWIACLPFFIGIWIMTRPYLPSEDFTEEQYEDGFYIPKERWV